MDGQQATKPKDTLRRHIEAFKHDLVDRNLVPGELGGRHRPGSGINANLRFNWQRLHLPSMAAAGAATS